MRLLSVKNYFLKHFSVLVWNNFCWYVWPYFTSVMEHNHRNTKVVWKLEQLIEFSKAQVKRSQIPMSLKRYLRCRAGTEWRERRKKFKRFLPLIIMRSVRSLADKIDKVGALMRIQQQYQEGNIIFSLRPGCENSSNTYLHSFKTKQADRKVTVKEEVYSAC